MGGLQEDMGVEVNKESPDGVLVGIRHAGPELMVPLHNVTPLCLGLMAAGGRQAMRQKLLHSLCLYEGATTSETYLGCVCQCQCQCGRGGGGSSSDEGYGFMCYHVISDAVMHSHCSKLKKRAGGQRPALKCQIPRCCPWQMSGPLSRPKL